MNSSSLPTLQGSAKSFLALTSTCGDVRISASSRATERHAQLAVGRLARSDRASRADARRADRHGSRPSCFHATFCEVFEDAFMTFSGRNGRHRNPGARSLRTACVSSRHATIQSVVAHDRGFGRSATSAGLLSSAFRKPFSACLPRRSAQFLGSFGASSVASSFWIAFICSLVILALAFFICAYPARMRFSIAASIASTSRSGIQAASRHRRAACFSAHAICAATIVGQAARA